MSLQRPFSAELIHILHKDLHDEDTTSTQDIGRCGSTVIKLLRQAVDHTLLHIDRQPFPRPRPINYSPDASSVLGTLFTLADDHINSVPYSTVLKCWLRLYTDCTIVQTLLSIFMGPSADEVPLEFWPKVVRRLDMAIIVAGAPGENRMRWIQKLIKEVQSSWLQRRSQRKLDVVEDTRPVKRARTSPAPLLYAPIPIPDITPPPSISEYVKFHHKSPFILRSYLRSSASPCPPWAAIDRWRSAEYILDRVGEGRVVPVEVGGAYDEQDWGQRIIPFRDFLQRAGFDVSGEKSGMIGSLGPPMYLAQHALFNQFPELEQDISMPDYVWSSPPPPVTMPQYMPPQNDDGVAINVWVGSGNGEIVSPAHTDPYYNCYAQVLGCKRVWLAPPDAGPYMRPHRADDYVEEERGFANQYITNTSTVPILRHDNEFTQLSIQYPEFFSKVWPKSMEAVLEPGDLLLMPPGWWHAMRGEGEAVGWSVSMWY